MKKSIVRLDIDDSKYLTLEFLGPVDELYLFQDITITYHANDKKCVLYTKDFVCDALRTFAYELEFALKDQFTLHESISKDIGFLWNEYLQKKENHIFIE